MDIIEIIKAVILGIVQGITEWLPVSSTGHMILVEEFMKFNLSKDFVDTFFVVVQFGSILAVIVMFFNKLNPIDPNKTDKQRKDIISLWMKIIVAEIPAGIIGVLFEDKIDELFYNVTTVAFMLIIYGVIFIIMEKKDSRPKFNNLSEITFKLAFAIGMFQLLALIPGTSRSGATIVGAVLLGTSRYIAAEFSFFLAVPIMLGASTLKLLKSGLHFTQTEWVALGAGSVVAFVVSLIVIKFLMDYIKKHDFKVFGYYRIILGVILLGYFYIIV